MLLRAALKLAAGAAAIEEIAAVSAAEVAIVAASAEGGGRTVTSQDTSALACSWRTASPRRDACTEILIHDAGTLSLAARSAASEAMTALFADVPAAVAGTVTVNVRVTATTAVADGLVDCDVDGVTLSPDVGDNDGDGCS